MTKQQDIPLDFTIWWDKTYKGKLGVQIIEDSFKEVALAAWLEQQKYVDEFADS